MSNFGRPLDFVAIPLSMRAEIWRHSTSDVGKALRLAMFCAEQLNGGVIKNARKWTLAEWRSYVNFSTPLMKSHEGLFTFVKDDLVVHIYNPDYEKSVLSRRKTNSNNAKNRWENDAIAFPKHNSTELNSTELNSTALNATISDDDDDTGQARRAKNLFEVEEFLRSHEKHMSREQVDACAADFWRMNEERGWSDSDGEPLRNWQGAARAYADKWRQRIRSGSGGGGAAPRHEEKGTDTDSIDDFFTN